MLKMGVFFTEGLCFDAGMEGNGGPSGGVPHYLQRSAQISLAAWERGKAKGWSFPANSSPLPSFPEELRLL
jgi:hypothetical protein